MKQNKQHNTAKLKIIPLGGLEQIGMNITAFEYEDSIIQPNLHPVYYRHIYRNGCHKFRRFAVNVWGISDRGKTEEETACEGVEALAGFIKEVGLPVTLRDLGADENTDLRQIADSCSLSAGSYKQMTHKEILEIFQECY